MSKDDLPLYELFNRLRGAGFLLGASDYNLLLELLLADCDTSNRTLLTVLTDPGSIKNLCQTLWVKTASQRLLFEEIFAEVFNNTLDYKNNVAINKEQPPHSNIQNIDVELEQKNNKESFNNSLFDKDKSKSYNEGLSNQNNVATNKEQLSPSNSQYRIEEPYKAATQNLDKKLEQQKNQENLNDTPIDKDKGEYFFFPPAPSSNLETCTENSQEVVKAIRTVNPYEWVSFKRSGLPNEYFPVTAQQMQQTWYTLRRPIREGQRLELDIAATIEETKRLGKFFYPVKKPRVNKLGQLVLLIDQKGSMQPFHILSRLLVETALKTGCLENTSCYYFNNYPRSVLYGDPQFQTEYLVEEVIKRFNFNRTIVLIFSDAGAARGNFMLGRIKKTFDFLEKIQQYCKALTWLNPVPEHYWEGTTAEAIIDAKIIKMFSASFSGFQNAIGVLQ